MNFFAFLSKLSAFAFITLFCGAVNAQEHYQQQFININFASNSDNVGNGISLQLPNHSRVRSNPAHNRVVQQREPSGKNKPSLSVNVSLGKKAEKRHKPSAGKRIPFKYRHKRKWSLFAAKKRKAKFTWAKRNKKSKKECAFLASR